MGMRSIIICIIDSIMSMRFSIISGPRRMPITPADGLPDAVPSRNALIMRMLSCMVFICSAINARRSWRVLAVAILSCMARMA